MVAALLFVNLAHAVSNDAMIDSIQYAFETQYAHRYEKATRYGWDLDKGIATLRKEVKTNPDMAKFSFLRFFSGFSDAHVGATFYSTETSWLPFDVKECNGRYFVVSELYKGPSKPINVGDELTHWDGKPIASVVNKFLTEEYCFGNDNPVRREEGVNHLTWRSGEMGMRVPKGKVVCTFKSPGAWGSTNVTEEWRYTQELVPPYREKRSILPIAKSAQISDDVAEFLNKCSEIPYAKTSAFRHRIEVINNPLEAKGSHALGDRRGYLPVLGTVTWESSAYDPFYAYICTTPNGQKIGFIRIGNYKGTRDKTKKFAEHVRRFQSETDMLVIDQLNNPGGHTFYCYALLSNLSDKPLKLFNERAVITNKDVYYASADKSILAILNSDALVKQIYDDFMFGLPMGLKEAKAMMAYGDFIQAQWNKGNTMTDPYPLLGIQEIRPSPGAYNKPIIVLVNHLDFSCGDIFPALLQDNKRAVIMGQRTGGAGATLSPNYVLPNRLGIKHFFMGTSQVLRFNGENLEDNGVTPDVPYEFTVKDYQYDYCDFVSALYSQIDRMLEGTTP